MAALDRARYARRRRLNFRKESPMRRPLAAILLLACPLLVCAAPPAGFDARVEKALAQLGAVGAYAAIVEDGKVTLARGYGLRHMDRADKVGADTIFQIGSVSKAFTAAALATLVDEGRIKWDDRVIDHLPDFRMYDPWVTREITIRDLLVHRSGLALGHGDLMFVPATHLTRADTVRRVRYLPPATSFRSAYAYDNVLYIVAGQLVEAVTGKTWEAYVRERLLVPAGMTRSVTSDDERFATADRAFPHGRLGEVRGIGPQQVFDEKAVMLGVNCAPAGAIAASANDMTRWVLAQLGTGRIPGASAPLFSEANAREMWRGVVPVPITRLPPPLAELVPQFRLYALGWNVQDYRGQRIVTHGGGTQGMRAVVTLIPGKNVGFALAVNSEDNALVPGLQYELLDHYLGARKRDWVTAFADFFDKRNAEALAALQASRKERLATKPSLALVRYAGKYTDAWYGPMEIREEGGALRIAFLQTPTMVGPLEHWAYDTFIARWTDRTIEPAFVTFALDPNGEPARVTMKAVSPVADFSFDYHHLDFTRVPEEKR
jgi:CubicO group peptidase (beta-lactamase class C family)